jgi:hypothetical protein
MSTHRQHTRRQYTREHGAYAIAARMTIEVLREIRLGLYAEEAAEAARNAQVARLLRDATGGRERIACDWAHPD